MSAVPRARARRALCAALLLGSMPASRCLAQARGWLPAVDAGVYGPLQKQDVEAFLRRLFSGIEQGALDAEWFTGEHARLGVEVLAGLAAELKTCSARLVNAYPVGRGRLGVSIALVGADAAGAAQLECIVHLLLGDSGQGVRATIPLEHLTRDWNRAIVGRTRYHFRGRLDVVRAALFDRRNERIARQLGVAPESFEYFLCDDYQEILALLGITEHRGSTGVTADGYGVVAGTILAAARNEDFSHDVFHHYSRAMRGPIKANALAEEGTAYSWGNAYYASEDGATIEQRDVVAALRRYLSAHPAIMPASMLIGPRSPLPGLPAQVSARSALASLLVDEVERQRGVAGVLDLLRCGPGDDAFYAALESLLGLTRAGLETALQRLLAAYPLQ